MKNMKNFEEIKQEAIEESKPKSKNICSTILKDGSIVEMIFQDEINRTQLVVFKDGEWEYKSSIKTNDQVILLPYPADNDLIKNKIILFPSRVEEFESEAILIKEIQSFIHHYLDISEFFEKIATHYVFFSWVYDKFNELPYLRALGDYGCGKTRFLQVIGSLCYKPIFAGGATTTSPIFRILNDFGGTFILDEADFKLSDATSDIIKILNQGFARGFPVLRSEGSGRKGKYEVTAFDVFGPKIVATRGKYQDKALESRFLVEEMDKGRLREDIPINIPNSFYKKAEKIRNKLLYWRFLNYGKKYLKTELVDRTLEPRLNQIIVPLLSIIENKDTIKKLKLFIKDYGQQLISDRGTTIEGQVLESILSLRLDQEYTFSEIRIKDIADNFNEETENPKEKISSRKIGWIVRDKLKLKVEKTRRGYVLLDSNEEKIKVLKTKYGIKEELLKESEHVNVVNVKDDPPLVE